MHKRRRAFRLTGSLAAASIAAKAEKCSSGKTKMVKGVEKCMGASTNIDDPSAHIDGANTSEDLMAC